MVAGETTWVLPKVGVVVDTQALALADRRVRLRPAGPADGAFVQRTMDSHRQVSHDWPRPGGPAPVAPTGARFFVAHGQASGEPIGVALAYDISDRHGRAYAGVVMDPSTVGSGLGMSVFLRLADYLFAVHPLRKLYLRAVEYSLAQYRSLVRNGHVTVEGVFAEYEYFGGRHWDVYTLAMSRAQFQRFKDRFDRYR